MYSYIDFVIWFYSKGKGLEKHILVVIMQTSKNGQEEMLSYVLGTADHPLHIFKSTKILYLGRMIFSCPTNERAKEDINNFLS